MARLARSFASRRCRASRWERRRESARRPRKPRKEHWSTRTAEIISWARCAVLRYVSIAGTMIRGPPVSSATATEELDAMRQIACATKRRGPPQSHRVISAARAELTNRVPRPPPKKHRQSLFPDAADHARQSAEMGMATVRGGQLLPTSQSDTATASLKQSARTWPERNRRRP